MSSTTAVLFSLSILQCFLLHDLKQQRRHHWLINVCCSVYDVTTKRVMVMLKVISLALLFWVRLRFPVDKSIVYVFPSRYGNTVVEDRKFEKTDFALRKCKLDLLFLETCLENQVIPKFLNFLVSNLHLKTSRAYQACQLKLLREEIALKRSRMKTFEKDFNTRKRKLKETLDILGYTHACCLFLDKNDKKLKKKQDIHSKKLFNLGIQLSQHNTTLKR